MSTLLPRADQVGDHEVLFDSVGLTVTRVKPGCVEIFDKPRYFMAFTFAFFAALLACLLASEWFLIDEPLWQIVLQAGSFWGYSFYIAFIGAIVCITFGMAFVAAQAFFGRRTTIDNHSLKFRGVPGFGFSVAWNNVEAVDVILMSYGSAQTFCHVCFVLQIAGRLCRLRLNLCPICGRFSVFRRFKGTAGYSGWLASQHRPLAELLGAELSRRVTNSGFLPHVERRRVLRR